eukprot:TRINITY_DN49745_c0_g1_i1.p1 TRINITY_DN49745_c0_g1~~TRINITY_DN49745_c0_g1_i1.p1  ORF type:complete len:308 (-),score=74.95 TRINITY_DN49745_c0_g1_i1:84-983(-)
MAPVLFLLCAALVPLTVRLQRGFGLSGLASAEGAQDLIDKFQELEALVKDSHGSNPELQSQLEALRGQLNDLKTGQARLEAQRAEMMERTLGHTHEADSAERLWIATCFAMATESLGGRLGQEDMSALRRLASDELPRSEAAGMPLFHMLAACLPKRTEEGPSATLALEILTSVAAELGHKRPKNVPPLPEAWLNQSRSEAAETEVRELPVELWDLMRRQAEIVTKPKPVEGPPMVFLLAGILPGVRLITYLHGKWKERKRNKEEQQAAQAAEALKSSEESKESKKSPKAVKQEKKKDK